MSDIENSIVTKICTQCCEEKPITEFYKNKVSKDFHKTQCKKCYTSNRIEYNKSYQELNKEKLSESWKAYRESNKEKISERNKTWYEANKEYKLERDKIRRSENKEVIAAQKKAWNEANKERNVEYAKIYREKNRETLSANQKTWCKENPERRAAHYRTKRARRNLAPGSHTSSDISNLYNLQKGKCACCLKSIKKGYQVDHIVALSKGGSNDKYNLQLLCAPCNLFKRAKDPIKFNQSLGLLL
jgi:outer membrane PBP1 activator LpoA protein